MKGLISYVLAQACAAVTVSLSATGSLLLLWLAPLSSAWSAEKTAAQGGTALGGADPLSLGSMVQVTLGLLAVVVTIFALAWFLRRYGRFQSSSNSSLKVVGGLSVGPRERVVLIQVEDRQLLLGVAPGRVQMLHTLDGRLPLEEANDAQGQVPKKNVFASLLKSV